MLGGKYVNPQILNDQCRQHKVGFISSQTFGPWGYGFLDYGVEHLCTDPDGEAVKNYIVTLIVKGEKTVITTHEDKRHIYQPGDYVVLKEVEGMTEINDTEPLEVIDTTKDTITLKLDSTNFGDYLRQGVIENIKVPQKVSYHPWSESYINPVASSRYGMLETPDLAKFGRSEQLHAALMGVLEFLATEGRYPENTADDQKKCLDLAKALIAKGLSADESNFQTEIEDAVFKTAVSFPSCSISPMAAFFGGIIAQEIVKYTGKYSTLKQWLHFDIYETLPREVRDCSVKGSRYDDQIKIYGNELQEKLKKVNLFMVGAGALGCELIKAFALMGIGCSAEGKVHCTDNDNIEVSNLNRQFLFRQSNVGHSKSECACTIAKGINPELNVKDYMTRVGEDTEAVFNDKLWESLDFVVNAVDNINARLYVDQRCVWFEKPLLESGTLGTKANSQMIVPHKTQCYGDSQDPPEEAIPMCTLRNFPN
jgi:ubiquitin-activating enzyme E1